MAEPIPPSAQSSSYSLTSLSSQCLYGQTGSDGHERKDADAALRTIFVPFEAKGVLYAWGPVQPSNGPPTRTTSGYRLVIHRQTSAHERRKWTRNVQSRSGILAYLCTRQHWLWITVELHKIGARHGEAVAREGGRYAPVRRVLGSEPLSLRTHRRRGRSAAAAQECRTLSSTRLHQ